MMTRIKRAGLLAACAVLLCAGSAAAVDGEVLINQARALAGGITPGDTAGFPITIDRAGRYKLAGNLAVPADLNGIEVTASDVTVDLNGFTIRSSSSGAARTGVFALTSVNGTRVMNGTITGFGDHGFANRASNAGRFSVVENMRIVSNGSNGRSGVFVGSDVQIRDSIIANNRGGNISCLEPCLIERSVITASGNGAGIAMRGGTVLGNVIVSNKFSGLVVDGGAGYGNNILTGNNSGGGQVSGATVQLHPNVCDPACP